MKFDYWIDCSFLLFCAHQILNKYRNCIFSESSYLHCTISCSCLEQEIVWMTLKLWRESGPFSFINVSVNLKKKKKHIFSAGYFWRHAFFVVVLKRLFFHVEWPIKKK